MAESPDQLIAVGRWEPPRTCLPTWGSDELPIPAQLGWRQWRSFVGPGLVMMGVQIGGGEWLFGPEITARFGGGLMWLATIAIVLQVFYNLEVGRYALFCGEPVFSGFLRTRPGPQFWAPFFVLLSLGAILPGLAFHAASAVSAIWLGRPPDIFDRSLVLTIASGCIVCVFLPVLFGGKVYDTLQLVMTIKIVGVLAFCLTIGLLFVSWGNWWDVVGGFIKFGNVPSLASGEGAPLVNVIQYAASEGRLPSIDWADIAVIGAFVGYAGGGGLGNSLYGNYVRDKGWGMGLRVGAIPSAIGGRDITLSHFGKTFPINGENLARWSGWWRVILVDQLVLWAPGCFVGMALPALLSLEFAHNSPLFKLPTTDAAAIVAQTATAAPTLEWANAVITADGMRLDPRFSATMSHVLWLVGLLAGLLVLLPSQMSVVDEVSRRWTDVIWSASRYVRETFDEHQVRYVYYSLAAAYFIWCISTLYVFGSYGTPRLMTLVIANLGNLALEITSFHILWINCRWLPSEIRPAWYQRLGLASCGVLYLTLTAFVFMEKQWPIIQNLLF